MYKQWPSKEVDKELFELFYSCLYEYNAEIIAAGIKRLLKTEASGFPPTIGQLGEAIYQERKSRWEVDRKLREEEQLAERRQPITDEDRKREDIIAATRELAKQKGFQW